MKFTLIFNNLKNKCIHYIVKRSHVIIIVFVYSTLSESGGLEQAKYYEKNNRINRKK